MNRIHKDNPYLKINEYLNEIKVMQTEALTEIRQCLSRMLHETMKGARIKRGVLSKKNDYRNYVWLSVPDGDSEYWITTFYLDIDPKSGNIHNQIGRIQFWKNIHSNKDGAVASPNMPAEDGRHYLFCPENSYDPDVRIYDRGFSAWDVAMAFNTFMTKDRRERKHMAVQAGERTLSGMKFTVFDPAVDNCHIIPRSAGNYLIALKPGSSLPPCPVDYVLPDHEGLKVIYTGVSKNLQQRDYRAHFTGTAGRSTLRKSLGCFWGYAFVPRDRKNPDNGKVMYSAADEAALTEWMEKNLLVLFCANEEYEKHEEQLISGLNPPLNLDKNHNSVNSEFRKWLKGQRTKR